jgi:NADH:ubiquinone oxidoreductase subunit 5 (subunit L)/multisubunit Na+/H+ antiporter MnhA subunit
MIMWGPIAILVALVVIVGFFGLVGVFNPHLSPEIFIEEQMHHMLHDILPHEVELHLPHPEVSTKLTAVGTSAVMLLIGGFVGWIFYLSKRLDPWKLVTGNSVLKQIHTFLWNRWYMHPIYYKIFVDGILSVKDVVFRGVEQKIFANISDTVASLSMSFSDELFQDLEIKGVDGVINHGVPNLFTAIYQKLKKAQTGVLSYNITYVVLMLIIIVLGLILMR